MFTGLSPLIAAVSALLPGLVIGYLLRQIIASKSISSAESKAEGLLAEAKSQSQDILLESKNKAILLLEEAKKEEKDRRDQVLKIENLLTKKESELEQKDKDLNSE